MGALPSFTVLVCTRDRPQELERCLRSVRELDYPVFDIVVVDSAPRHHPAREAARRWGARYIYEPVPGVSRARNCGARASSAEFVAIIDDEAVADRDLLRAFASEFDDPRVAAVAGRIKDFPVHTIEERLCAALGGADCGEAAHVVDMDTPLWFERACFGGIGNGGNLAFRRDVFDVWPGFCESLGAGSRIAGGEEHYAFFELIQRGSRVVYSPFAHVSHPCPRNLEELKSRHARSLCASIGYMGLLFIEQPQWRWRILNYVLEALRGARRPWRGNAQPRGVRVLPRWHAFGAIVQGIVQLARSRLGAPAPVVRSHDAVFTDASLPKVHSAPATVVYLERRGDAHRSAKKARAG